MTKTFLKILLVLLAVTPIWLTLAAFAATNSAVLVPSVRQSFIPSDAWKDRINSEFLKMKDKRIQVTRLVMTNEPLDDSLLKTEFKMDLSELKPRGTSKLNLQFTDSEGRLVRLVRLPVIVYMQEKAIIAARTLQPGTKIAMSDLLTEWREVNLFFPSVKSMDVVIGRTVRNVIREGEEVSEGALEKDVLVSRGDRIRIEVISKGLNLSLVGIAQESGQKGQTIRVINADSKKELFGTVTEAKQVEVRL